MTITFPIVTACVVYEEPLRTDDWACWDTCGSCVAAGREFAKDLGPEHETETEGVEA